MPMSDVVNYEDFIMVNSMRQSGTVARVQFLVFETSNPNMRDRGQKPARTAAWGGRKIQFCHLAATMMLGLLKIIRYVGVRDSKFYRWSNRTTV